MRILKHIFTQGLILALIFITFSAAHADSDHALFEPILATHVSNGFVDYPAIKNEANFKKYIAELGKPLATSDKNEQLAFWINAYNAFAIKGILDGRSPSTFFGRVGYFKNAKYLIGGETMNLFDLEREIIIPFGEPRIHFAINCASASCPKLISETYQAATLEEQLEESARKFILDPSRNKFDRGNKILYVSKIFDWFEKDFVEHSGSVQKYIAQFVKDPKLVEALRNEEYTIKYLEYDWSLNGKSPS